MPSLWGWKTSELRCRASTFLLTMFLRCSPRSTLLGSIALLTALATSKVNAEGPPAQACQSTSSSEYKKLEDAQVPTAQ